jgi:hypothetical protein
MGLLLSSEKIAVKQPSLQQPGLDSKEPCPLQKLAAQINVIKYLSCKMLTRPTRPRHQPHFTSSKLFGDQAGSSSSSAAQRSLAAQAGHNACAAMQTLPM